MLFLVTKVDNVPVSAVQYRNEQTPVYIARFL